VYDLPSDAWFELIEECSCHPDHFATTHPHDGAITSKPHAILVGDTFFQIHPSALLTPEALDGIEGEIRCRGCHVEVGTVTDLTCVKFDKYSVIPVCGGEVSLNLQQWQTVEQVVAGEICRRAKDDALFRFVIRGRNSGKIFALIWLLNWESFMATNCTSYLNESVENETRELVTEEHTTEFAVLQVNFLSGFFLLFFSFFLFFFFLC